MPILLLALLPVPPKLSHESVGADEIQRQMNADALQAVFDLILAPLQEIAKDGAVMDCADGKTRLCFPILSAWIADHAEHTILNGISSNSCPQCEVPATELGQGPRNIYEPRNYAHYAQKTWEYMQTQDTHIADYFHQIGMKIDRNVFSGLYRVNPADLHKPDLLHNIYLGLFKHMMKWVEGFLKKHKRQQAFDDIWKALPPYPGFNVPKKAYREVTQSQGEEMRNLCRCISAVFASALRNPDGSQQLPFKRALQCVCSMIDFTLMAQYRSHTLETLGYMETYLRTFHRTKDIFLEFRTTKAIRAQAERQDRELRERIANADRTTGAAGSAPNRRRRLDEARIERANQWAELIQRENHFNFIKMHYLNHFVQHVRRFGSVPMYSTDIGELAHKEQIKEGYRRSNKNHAARQILAQYSKQHAIGMRLLTMEALRKTDDEVETGNVGVSNQGTCPNPRTPRRALKGRTQNVGTVFELCLALEIHYDDLAVELVNYVRQTTADERQLPVDPSELKFLPAEQFTQLEIPVPDFQETDIFQVHRARCTGRKSFRNSGARNDWIWIQAGGLDMYGELRGRAVARLVGLFKIRNVRTEVVSRLAYVQVLDPVNGGRFHGASGHIRVCKRRNGRDMRIIDIGVIVGQAHVVPYGDGQWLVNHRIDLRTFNDIY